MQESEQWSISPGVCWAYGLETTDGYQVLYSKRHKHFWTQVLYPLLSQDPIRMRQQLYWGNMMFLWHPSQPKQDLIFADYYNLSLLSLANTRYILSPVPLHHSQLRLLPSEHREQFIATNKRKLNERFGAALKNEWSYKPVYIYENQQALPRYFLVPQVTVFDDEFDLLASLRNAATDQLQSRVFLLSSDIPPDLNLDSLQSSPATESIGTVKKTQQAADQAEYEINATGPCIFFLSNSYNPDWHAELNEQPARVLPVHLTFQGVYIPAAGKHRLKLSYRPLYRPATYWK